MSKAKTNALDALRALIAERQQYEGWLSTLEAKKEGTAEHVYERVRGDYMARLDRVVSEIRGHAEELQLSISALSSRLVEVAREEDTRREGLQEAELRAAVGEYEPDQWKQLKSDAEQALERIATDRKSLDDQLSELRSIQKLSEATTPVTDNSGITREPTPVREQSSAAIPIQTIEQTVEKEVAMAAATDAPESQGPGAPPEAERAPEAPRAAAEEPAHARDSRPTPPQDRMPLAEPVAQAASSVASAASRPRSTRTPHESMGSRGRSESARPDAAKTLKCPECGTPNNPTEWYCERCGGELATV
jgi:hypothetical protein